MMFYHRCLAVTWEVFLYTGFGILTQLQKRVKFKMSQLSPGAVNEMTYIVEFTDGFLMQISIILGNRITLPEELKSS